MGKNVDLTHLSEQECENILKVVQRDFELRQQEKERLEKLQTDVAELESKAGNGGVDGSTCSLCNSNFRFLLNPRYRCSSCAREFCKKCILRGEAAAAAAAAHAAATNNSDAAESAPDICKICELHRSYKRQTNSWFYGTIQRRYKRFGSAKVVRSLYRRKTASTDALYYRAGDESEGENEEGTHSGYQSETGLDKLVDKESDKQNLALRLNQSNCTDGLMEDIVEDEEEEEGLGVSGGTLSPFKRRLRLLAKNIHRIRYIRQLQEQFEQDPRHLQTHNDEDNNVRPVIVDSEDKRRQRDNIKSILTDMIHNLMSQLQVEDGTDKDNIQGSGVTSGIAMDEQPCKEVLRQCVPHLCTSIQEDIEPTVNPIIPFGIDYRELSLNAYITQLSSSILALINEEPTDIEEEEEEEGPQNYAQEIMPSQDPDLKPTSELEASLGRTDDEFDQSDSHWLLRGRESLMNRGSLLLGQRSVPYDRRLERTSQEEDPATVIYLPSNTGADQSDGLKVDESQARDERLSESTVTEDSVESDIETSSDIDLPGNKATDSLSSVEYPSTSLSRKEVESHEFSADDSCCSTDVEEGGPRFLSPPDSVTVQCGQRLKVDCRVQGTRPIDVFWYRDSTTLEQLDDERYLMTRRGLIYSLEVTQSALPDSGLYLCIAVNEHGHCQHRFVVTVSTQEEASIQLIKDDVNGYTDLNTQNAPKLVGDNTNEMRSSEEKHIEESSEDKRLVGENSSDEPESNDPKVSTNITEATSDRISSTVAVSSSPVRSVSASIISARIVSSPAPVSQSLRVDNTSRVPASTDSLSPDLTVRADRDLVTRDTASPGTSISSLDMSEEGAMVSTSFLNQVIHDADRNLKEMLKIGQDDNDNKFKDFPKGYPEGSFERSAERSEAQIHSSSASSPPPKAAGVGVSAAGVGVSAVGRGGSDRNVEEEHVSYDEFERLYESEILRSSKRNIPQDVDDKIKTQPYRKYHNNMSDNQINRGHQLLGEQENSSKTTSDQNLVPLMLDFSIADTASRHLASTDDITTSSDRRLKSPAWSRDMTRMTKDSGISMPDSPRSSWSGSDTPNSGVTSPIEYRHHVARHVERSASKLSSQLSWSAESESSSMGYGKTPGSGNTASTKQKYNQPAERVIYRDTSNRYATPVSLQRAAMQVNRPEDKVLDYVDARERFGGSRSDSQISRRLSNASSCSSTYDIDSELEGAALPSVRDLKKIFDNNRQDGGVKRVYSLTTRIPPPSLRGFHTQPARRVSSDSNRSTSSAHDLTHSPRPQRLMTSVTPPTSQMTTQQPVTRGPGWTSSFKDAHPSRIPQLRNTTTGVAAQQSMPATYVPLSPRPVSNHVKRADSSNK